MSRSSKSRENEEVLQFGESCRDMTTKSSMWFWTGSFCYKGCYQDKWQNPERLWGLDGNNVSMLISWSWWQWSSYIGEKSLLGGNTHSIWGWCALAGNWLSGGSGEKVHETWRKCLQRFCKNENVPKCFIFKNKIKKQMPFISQWVST